MSYVAELREQQARIATNAQSKLDEIKDDTPEERAAEIEREFDAMMADYKKIEARADRYEQVDAAQRAAEAGDPRRPGGLSVVVPGVVVENTPDYKDVFTKYIRFGTADMKPEERAVLMGGKTSLPPEMRAQSAVSEAAGGFTVPEGFSGEIDKQLAIWGPMYDGGITRDIVTSSGNKLPWPTINDTLARGRVKPENASVDDDGTDDVVFGEVQLDAFVYDTGMVRIPMELLMDSDFNIEMLLNDLFAERLGRTCNQVLTNGTGVNEPHGILTAASTGVTSATPAALTADDLIDMLHSVDPAYRDSPKCCWQFNDTTLAAIRKLRDGEGNFLWQMNNIQPGEPDSILGKPYKVNQAMPDVASGATPILFGDHSRYIVRKVKGFQVLTLRERYAENFQVGMVGFKRFDGELLNSAAVKKMLIA